MTDTLNSQISLYRFIGQQRHLMIAPQLAQLSESIAQRLKTISQQEQAWIEIETDALSCFRHRLIRDIRDLMATDDFENFLAQLRAVGQNDLDSAAKTVLVIEPEEWQLKALTIPIRLQRYQILTQPHAYRIKIALGTWQQSLEGSIFTAEPMPLIRAYALQWIELHHQLKETNFQLDLDKAQQAQLWQEMSCLVCYVGSLICIRQLAAEFAYP
ncbi:hypothetical protein ACQ4M3_40605 [Leptolyngbya sp. AN03gr2]|uniref:hypothetical protein n=1 Tax=unclassified Leptolyngbya TaxID=2650499 RepID=UPI003D31BC65